MNKDLDERLIPQGEYRDALNIKVANSTGSDVGAIENALSNEAKSSLDLGSNAVCIGSISDDEDRVVYWFVKSDTGCFICYYDQKTNTSEILMSDTRLLTNQNPEKSVLNFSEAHMIQANILTDADNLKKFLYFTDGLNPPRRINVATAKGYDVNGFTDEDINVIVKPPLFPPSIKMKNTEEEENNIEEKFLLFAYRYAYEDGEKSALSPFSKNAFVPSTFAFDFIGAVNNSMKNSYNAVDITVNSGSKLVKSIDIVFKESGNNNIYLASNVVKSKEGYGNNVDFVYTFKNNSIYKVLAEDEIYRLYDNIPLTAESQDIISNRLVYGNYTENFNLTDSNSQEINLDLTAGYISNNKIDESPSETAKSNTDYEVGIAYLDEYGRSTTVVTSDNNSVYVNPIDSKNENKLTATINSLAPSFAKYYRFYVKQSKSSDYDIISPVNFYPDGDFLWVRLEGDDKNKIKEGDYLLIKRDVTGVKKNAIKCKVLDQGFKEKDFLEETAEDGTLQQESGYYIKIASSGANFTNFTSTTHYATDFDSTSETWIIQSGTYGTNFANQATTYFEGPFFYSVTNNENDMTISGTYSGANDARYEIRIDSTGATDQFVWLKYDVNSSTKGSFSSPINCSTSPIALSDGLSISFASATGHEFGDLYTINAKTALVASGFNQSDRSYITLNGISSDKEYLTSGSKMIFSYKEYIGINEKEENVNQDIFVEDEVFYTTVPYENIEEWFWGEGKEKFQELGFKTLDRFRFRRGQYSASSPVNNTFTVTGNPNDPLCLIIQSDLERGNLNNVYADSSISISIRDNKQYAILETIPSKNNSDVFYEIPGTYIVDDCGYHKGISSDDVDQNLNNSAFINLNFTNAFSFGNGFECYKVRDAFISNALTINNRPLTYIENYRENHRSASITYSDVYEQSTNYNGLNEFNLSRVNYMDLDDEYGDIKRIHSRDTNLVVFQENKVSYLPYQKSILYNADGSGNVAQSLNVFGNQVPYSGEYGISSSAHSFTSWANRMYFADERRGAIMRLSQDGLTEISQFGMRDWFRDNVDAKNENVILGGYDPFNGQYVVSIKDPVVEWREDAFVCDNDSCDLEAIVYLDPQTTLVTTSSTVPTMTDGWAFQAEVKTVGGILFVGFHQGTLLTDNSCTSPAAISHGLPAAPTTATTSLPGVNCYTSTFVNSTFFTDKGYGINGIGNVSNFALTQFSEDTSGNISLAIVNVSGTGNPGSGTLSGTITGNDGSSGTWSVDYAPIPGDFIDDNGNGNTIPNPESLGAVTLNGLILKNGATYYLNTQ